MTDWSKLEHARGSAEDIPEILARLSPDPDSRAMDELWERVCRFGEVYSASLPVLPHLLEIISTWEPKARVFPLSIAGYIVVGSTNRFPNELEEFGSTIRDLHTLTCETLRVGMDEYSFTYLLESAIAFNGDQVFRDKLHRICSGDFEGSCPRCEGYLILYIGQYGFFSTGENRFNNPNIPKNFLLPCLPEELEGSGAWLFEQCKKYGYEERAHWFRYLFGNVVCPHCSENISVAEAIKNGY